MHPTTKMPFKDDYTWIPCFGHNLHLAVNKAINIDRVSAALTRLYRTLSAFTRSSKLSRQLKTRQKQLGLPEHNLIHDAPTRWNSSYDMVERFLEQQQALCAVLAEDRKKRHLMPKDNDITILETLKEVLEPLSPFTDALSGEKHTTLSSVLPLLWKMLSCLRDKEDDSVLTGEMKSLVRESINQRYGNREVQLLLNTATYLDPRFKASFVALEDDMKQSLLEQVGNADDGAGTSETPMATRAEASSQSRLSKKSKTDLNHLLSAIQGEKKGRDDDTSSQAGLSTQEKLNGEVLVYSKMPELSTDEDPLI
ncbi:zinc finger BED domain-containing protein 4 isoform X4 [Pleuronectes platessa]|uniref:zinc finger BED domain-containing protein 4 isoform X4 n=1 Tax=Pleuronectes platessa TaxID=8262 RepID=UPI00232A791B|nr:zinc finger BED domain-containing protein 4 isoform X4 [Pleuronectes platessa]